MSVVIPTRDTKALTSACLDALAAATSGITCEIIVVDDGSVDGTREHIEQGYPGVRVIRHDQPAGFTVSANRGLQAATAPVLLLLNSDTEVLPGAVAALVEALNARPDLGIAGAQLLYPDGRPQWSGGTSPDLWWLFAQATGALPAIAKVPGYRRVRPLDAAIDREVAWVTGAALAMRRQVWTDVGPLDESFVLYGQDLDFCLRARQAGWRVAVIASARVLHHHGATIGQVMGTPRRQHPESLWMDLLRWARKARGPAYARRAGWALSAGGRLRLYGRALAAITAPRSARSHLGVETTQLRRALGALRASRVQDRAAH